MDTQEKVNFLKNIYYKKVGHHLTIFEKTNRIGKLDQIVSEPLTEDKAHKITTEFNKIHTCVKTEVIPSPSREGLFYAAITNPEEVLSVFLKKFADVLNENNTIEFPETLEFVGGNKELSKWFDGSGQLKYEVGVSRVYRRKSDTNVDKKLEEIKSYNTALKKQYPGLEIEQKDRRSRQSGYTESIITKFPNSAIEAILKLEKSQTNSLRDHNIFANQQNPDQLPNKESNQELPAEPSKNFKS